MKTQSTTYPDANAPASGEASLDGRGVKRDDLESAPIEARVRQMVETGKEMVESGKEHVTRWKGGLQDGIRERPVQYVLIAAAVGTVLGLLLGRRSRA